MRTCHYINGIPNSLIERDILEKIGFTTTIPVEILLAANKVPLDLNNIFVTDNSPTHFIDLAHEHGLPRNLCSWIKGLYGVCVEVKAVDKVITITNGDCSNTHALAELYEHNGIKTISFSYPLGERDPYAYLKSQMEALASELGTTLEKAIEVSKRTDVIRKKLHHLDRLTSDGKVSGFENHLWLVSSSDFNSDVDRYENELDDFIRIAEQRPAANKAVRVGVIGVPTINPAMYDFIEAQDCKVVLNEVQRQFSMVSESDDYVTRFLEYTYPYDVYKRIDDIKQQIEAKQIDGLIHYVQSFCYRQIQDILIKKHVGVPVLTIEGDAPGDIDGRTKIRIESFIEMLEHKKTK